MIFGFIKIHNTILDHSEYMKSVLLLKRYAEKKIIELLTEEGFEPKSIENPTYHEAMLNLYNKEKDLEIRIEIRKKTPEAFV
ncbi:hypothetical protein JW826_03190 [Candidatus Woesearchaeota archaeon]|nr:hypothetical protein [Candidatus Woesearchaeota archaeon]